MPCHATNGICVLLFVSNFCFAALADTSFQPVDINKASVEQIQALPGIGKKMAERIVEYRTEHGSFPGTAALLHVPGMKEKTYANLKNLILVTSGSHNKSKALKHAGKGNRAHEHADEVRWLKELMKNYPNEPSIQEVQKRVLEYAHLDPKMVASWQGRARRAGIVPKLHASIGRDTDEGRSLRRKIGDADTIYSKDQSNLNFKVGIEWNLPELVFSKHELGAARESNHMNAQRERMLPDVTAKYFERRQRQLEQKLDKNMEQGRELELHTRVLELTAFLDAATGGWFSAEIERRENS